MHSGRLGERPAGSRRGWKHVKVLVSSQSWSDLFFKGWPVKDCYVGAHELGPSFSSGVMRLLSNLGLSNKEMQVQRKISRKALNNNDIIKAITVIITRY